ncbi:hypothetical protein RMR16_021330 [Agrobacterium sp. rho-13.3]|uniref:hypothetical protein n=1 Tax=Agrobacterium sp. rho-13.3 TaxID=3072980 RepID=UPI002A13777A|nr:hypothetical protein [Agrobacterium sp. rho-13.3]MDX8306450.1 hypothetical protein [Agrobacterium sp. rho-13.3]MDX8307219.1 hypothetical protein [Agrobacterium sp. rho-13.3]
MSGAPLLRVKDVAIFERRLTMRMPFRFGAATVTEAGQVFVSLVAEDGQGAAQAIFQAFQNGEVSA